MKPKKNFIVRFWTEGNPDLHSKVIRAATHARAKKALRKLHPDALVDSVHSCLSKFFKQ